MNILDTTGKNLTTVNAVVNKGIGSLAFFSNIPFTDLTDEKINLYVQRNGSGNYEITNGFVNLKQFILASTYGTDAITSNESFETQCIIELAEDGAINLAEKDLITIELLNLKADKNYIFDGVEDSDLSNTVYQYELKAIASEHPQAEIDTTGFDIAVMNISPTINEIQKTFEPKGGRQSVCKFTVRELRALAQDLDPVAYLKKDGKAVTSFTDFMQLPLETVDKLTIRKEPGAMITILMRHQVNY